MNRKTSIAAAILAAVLIFLFSQAYVSKIEKINNSKKDNKESFDSEINITVSLFILLNSLCL